MASTPETASHSISEALRAANLAATIYETQVAVVADARAALSSSATGLTYTSATGVFSWGNVDIGAHDLTVDTNLLVTDKANNSVYVNRTTQIVALDGLHVTGQLVCTDTLFTNTGQCLYGAAGAGQVAAYSYGGVMLRGYRGDPIYAYCVGINFVMSGTDGAITIAPLTTDKIGFYGATAVDQPAAVADATGAGDVVAQLNLLLARVRELGLIAT